MAKCICPIATEAIIKTGDIAPCGLQKDPLYKRKITRAVSLILKQEIYFFIMQIKSIAMIILELFISKILYLY